MSAVRVRHRPPAFAHKSERKLPRPSPQRGGRSSEPGLDLCADGSALHHRFLEFLGGAECHFFAGLDLNGLTRRGIASFARGTLAHHENTQATDADPVAL